MTVCVTVYDEVLGMCMRVCVRLMHRGEVYLCSVVCCTAGDGVVVWCGEVTWGKVRHSSWCVEVVKDDGICTCDKNYGIASVQLWHSKCTCYIKK